MLRFHQSAIDLLATQPTISCENERIIAERESQIGFPFPASVREWYSLDRCIELLQEHSNSDCPVPLEQLGRPVRNWYGVESHDLLKVGILWIMGENQGVCNWAVLLDGSDDPPVVIEIEKVRATGFSQSKSSSGARLIASGDLPVC